MANVESFFDQASNTVTHIIWHTESKHCAIIDPVLDFDAAAGRSSVESAQLLLNFIEKEHLQVLYLLETHVHADHLSAAPYLRQKTKAPILIGKDTTRVEKAFQPIFSSDSQRTSSVLLSFDRLLEDGEKLSLGDDVIEVMNTPGHTAGCVSYVVGNMAFIGDTLFMPDFGTARTDFPGGDARTLYQSIHKILSLPDETRLYMCHDYKAKGRDEFAWETTVAEQKARNIHIKSGVSESEFVKFREHRDKHLSMPKLLLPAVQVNLCAGQLPEPEGNGVSYLKIPLNQF